MANCSVLFLLLLPLIFVDVQSTCVNKTALYDIKAVRHMTRRSSGRRFSGNFYDLDNQLMINVYRANVTDLCEGMVKNYYNLETLGLIGVNLSRIQPNAFQNMKRLRELSLAVNHLTELVDGAFANLPELEVLYLSGNQIERIEGNVFSDLVRLRAVHLDRNRIARITGNLFAGCPRLAVVDFAFNRIERLDAASFRDLRPKHRRHLQIVLTKNRIGHVDPAALDLPNPVLLHVEGNGLDDAAVISVAFAAAKERSRLYFNKNSFACVPDDVVLAMRNTSKDLDVRENPLRCDCMDRFDELLGEEIHGTGRLFYGSTLNCYNALFSSQ